MKRSAVFICCLFLVSIHKIYANPTESPRDELKQKYIEEQHREVESQKYLIGDWKKYRQELEEIQQIDAEERSLEEETLHSEKENKNGR